MIKDTLQAGLNSIIDRAGDQIMIRYFNESIGSVWDDELVLTTSGDVWTSGVVFPLSNEKGSQDSVLMEQGKLIDGDKRIFVVGSLNVTGSELQSKIQIGSPSGEVYRQVLESYTPEVNGEKIYKRIYVRKLPIGSLIGE